MFTVKDREFGKSITKLIQKENLTRNETRKAFSIILNNETTQMQQGAFLSALTAKGETKEEIAGSFDAIYELDTIKVTLKNSTPLVENSGTGMDSFKTFNISTAASLIVASCGIKMARHGARAITSACGTVDIAEALGVDVECSADIVAQSIEKAGIGLFNGMSPQIHPTALGRILSQISFGSTLNIAASLANPALPKIGVRGVYSKEMIFPVVKVMKEIGYERAIVIYGDIDNSDKGMDEASVCGTTWCAELAKTGEINQFSFHSSDFAMGKYNVAQLLPSKSMKQETQRFISLLKGEENNARSEAAILNAGLIFHITGKTNSIGEGVEMATETLKSGTPFSQLQNWVAAQNNSPEIGLKKLERVCL